LENQVRWVTEVCAEVDHYNSWVAGTSPGNPDAIWSGVEHSAADATRHERGTSRGASGAESVHVTESRSERARAIDRDATRCRLKSDVLTQRWCAENQNQGCRRRGAKNAPNSQKVFPIERSKCT